MSKGPETFREFLTKDNTIGWGFPSREESLWSRNLRPWRLTIGCRVTADIEGSDDLIYAGAKHGFATLNCKTGELSYFRKLINEETVHKIGHRLVKSPDCCPTSLSERRTKNFGSPECTPTTALLIAAAAFFRASCSTTECRIQLRTACSCASILTAASIES